jgi:hypothetical protein
MSHNGTKIRSFRYEGMRVPCRFSPAPTLCIGCGKGHPLEQFPWKGGRGRLSLIHEAPIIVRETPDVKEIRQDRTRARLATGTERYTFVRMSEHEVKEPPYLELPVGPVPEDDATPVAVIWKILRLLTLRSGLTRV